MQPVDVQKWYFPDSLANHSAENFASMQSALGKSVPASIVDVDETGTIVSVKVEMQGITIPPFKVAVYGPQWLRWPLQKGDKGVLLSADFYLGGMNGLGSGVATAIQQPNLSTGVFFPIGNAKFPPTEDPQKAVLYGPDGVILRDTNKEIIVTISPELGLSIIWHGQTLMRFDSEGVHIRYQGKGIDITSAGTFIDNISVPFPVHTHTGVQPGSGDTSVVNP